MKRRYAAAFGILVLAAAVSLFAGNQAIGTSQILRVLAGGGTAAARLIVFQIRLPRILAAMTTGTALSAAGYLLQNSLDNVLASPGILGINHGAGVFVLISAILFPYQIRMKGLMAFLGALVVTGIVGLLAYGAGMSKTAVILAGVAISALCSSVTDVLISLKPETVADKTAFLLGGFSAVSRTSLYIGLPVAAVVLSAAVWIAPALDVMALGDEAALGLGLNVHRYRGFSIVSAALLSGAAVGICGQISFVGLIVPNVLRMVCPGKSREDLILNMLSGAAFLLLCDTAARLLAFPYELPCGLILSLVGTPFLIWILLTKKRRLGTR